MTASTRLLRPLMRVGPRQAIGLMGGSFDPAHAGHAHVATTALKHLGLDQVWWLVAPQNPWKAHASDFAARLAGAERLARATTAGDRLIATDLERRLGAFRTIETLRALQARFPATRFVWVMGADGLVSMHLWRAWREIWGRLPICIVARPGVQGRALAAPAPALFARARLPQEAARELAWRAPPAWVYLRAPLVDLSSTSLRAQAGRSPK